MRALRTSGFKSTLFKDLDEDPEALKSAEPIVNILGEADMKANRREGLLAMDTDLETIGGSELRGVSNSHNGRYAKSARLTMNNDHLRVY